jgi:hypothetical protein
MMSDLCLTPDEHATVIAVARDLGPGSYNITHDIDRGLSGVERVTVLTVHVPSDFGGVTFPALQ